MRAFMASVSEPILGVWGGSPQRGPGALGSFWKASGKLLGEEVPQKLTNFLQIWFIFKAFLGTNLAKT